MATITSNVLQITVTDEGGYTKSFNIDNPVENISLNQIKTALQPAFSGRWWLGKYNSSITELKAATYTQTIKTQIAGETVSVTPASFTTDISASQSTFSQNFTVAGGTPAMAQFILPDSNKTDFTNTSVNITNDIVQLSTYYSATPAIEHTINATLKILVSGVIFDVPIIFNVKV